MHFNRAAIEIAGFYEGLAVPDIRGAFYTLVGICNTANFSFHRLPT